MMWVILVKKSSLKKTLKLLKDMCLHFRGKRSIAMLMMYVCKLFLKNVYISQGISPKESQTKLVNSKEIRWNLDATLLQSVTKETTTDTLNYTSMASVNSAKSSKCYPWRRINTKNAWCAIWRCPWKWFYDKQFWEQWWKTKFYV